MMMQSKLERAPTDAWEWLIDTLTEELSAMSDADAQHILARLDDRAGYHLVSDLAEMLPVETRRRELVDRLMARTWSGRLSANAFPPIGHKPVSEGSIETEGGKSREAARETRGKDQRKLVATVTLHRK